MKMIMEDENNMLLTIRLIFIFEGLSTFLVPLTREAIVPYLVAVSLQARMCNTVILDDNNTCW